MKTTVSKQGAGRGGKRKGAGRPKKAASTVIGFRADYASKRELSKVAKLHGKTLSQWLRDVALAAWISDPGTCNPG